jgi:hypothetical protein
MHGINQYDKKKQTVLNAFIFFRKNTPPLSESEFNIALDNSKGILRSEGLGNRIL